MQRIAILFILMFYFHFASGAQDQETVPVFSHADTLRGSLNPERFYNVLKYDIAIEPDYDTRSFFGTNTITYLDSGRNYIQIDLQPPLGIDSIIQNNRKLFLDRKSVV